MMEQLEKLWKLAEQWIAFAIKINQKQGYEYYESTDKHYVSIYLRNNNKTQSVEFKYGNEIVEIIFYTESIQFTKKTTEKQLQIMHNCFSELLAKMELEKGKILAEQNKKNLQRKYEALQAELSELKKQMK
jgi:hypothetical protein